MGYLGLLIIFGYFILLPEAVSGRQRWNFPKFNLKKEGESIHVDDPDKISALWYDQAITGLMAVVGTGLQHQLSPTSRSSRQLEQCSSKAEHSIQYAQCLGPVIRQKRLVDEWRKHREYRKRTEKTRRRLIRQNTQGQQMNMENMAQLASAASPFIQSWSQHNFPAQPQSPPLYSNDMPTSSQAQVPSAPVWDSSPNLVPSPNPPAAPTEKPFLVEIADWLTGAVKYMKSRTAPVTSPPVVVKKDLQSALNGDQHGKKNGRNEKFTVRDQAIEDTPVDGFVKRLFAPVLFGNTTGPQGWSGKHFGSQALLSNITAYLDSFLHTHSHSNGPKEIVPPWQLEFLQDVRHLLTDLTEQAKEQSAQQQNQPEPDSKYSVKLLSPRLLPFDSDQQQYDAKFLSPDILSFTDDGIASIPKMLGTTVGETSKESWLKFIMEASGVSDTMRGDPKLINNIINAGKDKSGSFRENVKEFGKVYDEVNNKFEEAFHRLYSTFTPDQIGRMEDRGFAYLSRDQIDYIYHSEDSPCLGGEDCKLDMNLDVYEKMSDAEKDEALMDFLLEFANAEERHKEPWTTKSRNGTENGKRRSKRTLLLTPVKFTPVIGQPTVGMPVILSPIIFSPIVLSPSVLGPIILSPLLFSPVILSPVALGGIILSPYVASPSILTPFALFPIILSPLVLNPFILCPYVLTPVILSPLVLSPAILDPNVLSPFILDPGVLSPAILSPKALSPVILSPQAVGALILSPSVLSPIVASPVVLFPVILSPSVLG